MNNLLRALAAMAAALLMLLAAWVGAEIQQVLAERDYYREKAQRAELSENINRTWPKF